jgi:hypothetical protein
MPTKKTTKSRAASARARAKAKVSSTTDDAAPETKAKPKRATKAKAASKAKAKPKRATKAKAAEKPPRTKSVRTSASATSGKGVAAAPEEKRTSATGYLSKYPYPARMSMTVPKSVKAPSTPVEHVQHAAKAILLSSGEGFVRRGQLQLYLATVAKATKDTEQARQWVAEAYDAGVLKPHAPAK